MKKWCVILAITLSAVLCACQRKTIQESRAESMVMHNGHITGKVTRQEATEESVLALAMLD